MSGVYTRRYVVAYMDILGTTQKIKNDVAGNNLKLLHSAIQKAFNLSKYQKGRLPIKKENPLLVKAFSDNVIFALKVGTSHEDEFLQLENMINAVSAFQGEITVRNRQLVHGAITIGKLFFDETMVWGEALLRAYELEERIAIFPRVILDRNMMERIRLRLPEQSRVFPYLGIWPDTDEQ